MPKVATNLLGCRVIVKHCYADKWNVAYEGVVRAVSGADVITLLLELSSPSLALFDDQPIHGLVTVTLDSQAKVLVVPEAT